MAILSNFVTVSPRFRKKQEEGLLWLVEAHVRSFAEAQAEGGAAPSSDELETFRHRMTVAFRRFGCNPPKVCYRSHEHPDFNHYDWSKMEIFRLAESPSGELLDARLKAYQLGASRAFSQWYESESIAPEHLIHVSCTGYLAPSAAQIEVLKRGWENRTTVTHLYHMGCYASFPAVRIADGFLRQDVGGRVDVAHTELCTLHLDPSNHEPEQIVMQSLFADGLIRYSLHDDATWSASGKRGGLKLLGLLEQLLPESESDMTWVPGPGGMVMTLSKEVPNKIGRAIESYVAQLSDEAHLTREELSRCQFAIHPGGPRIIDQIQDILKLSEDQVHFSREVLAHYGNMSSATLPHVWEACLESSRLKRGDKIVSMAFGPGLTMSGGVFEKVE